VIRALALKELRECAGVTAIGLLAFAWLLVNQTGLPIIPLGAVRVRNTIPFLTDDFNKYFATISAGLAVFLALRQSAWEFGDRIYDFLLFRPIQRMRLFSIKIVVGIAITLFCSCLPIILYAIWARVPGNTPTPFLAAMTATSWLFWVSLPTIYLGAFLSGIRPGQWFGTRLLPLIGAGGWAIICTQSILPIWGAGFTVLLIAAADYALIKSVSYFVYTRDY
jgi:hypothetical protein